MIIIAKFASTCPCCSQPIVVGAKVNWAKGSKATHVACGAARGTVTTSTSGHVSRARAPGKWTGCSCGSREDRYGDLIPSARNCFHCGHDAS